MSIFVRCDKCKEEFDPKGIKLILPEKEEGGYDPFYLAPITTLKVCCERSYDYDLCWHCIKQLIEVHLANA